MSVLRPKYQLDHGQVQGSRTTIPAEQFAMLTKQSYPYPRLGTRAPNHNPGSLSPKYMTDSQAAPASSGTVLAPSLYSGALRPKFTQGDGDAMAPHYLLDHAETQGVMPISTYRSLMREPVGPLARAGAARAPTLEFDWGSFFWGGLAGSILVLGFVYGVIPALAEWGAAEVRARTR